MGAASKRSDSKGPQDSGLGKDSSLHHQFIKDMSSITQMGIVNIENESLNKISPVKKDGMSQGLSSKIIEEVSEENVSQSAASMKKERRVAFPIDLDNNINIPLGKPPVASGPKSAKNAPD